MPIIQPDTSNVTEYTPMEPGTYAAKIIDCPYKMSKKENPMIVPEFEIEYKDKLRKKKAYLVSEGEGAGGFDQLLRATGFEEVAEASKRGERPEFDTDNLIGQEVLVVIEADMFNDKPSDTIKSYLRK